MPIPVFTSRIVTDATWTVQVVGGSVQTFASNQHYHLASSKSSAGNGQSFLEALRLLLNASSGLSWTVTLDANLKLKLVHDSGSLKKGTYRLVFDVAGYFKSRGVALPEPSFLDKVTLDFGVAQPEQHYHVPLLVSPWSYSTYRGS